MAIPMPVLKVLKYDGEMPQMKQSWCYPKCVTDLDRPVLYNSSDSAGCFWGGYPFELQEGIKLLRQAVSHC